jgi:carbon-monoxide dehydrogenase medium subunit
MAAGARLEVASTSGTRTIPLDELFQGPFTTSLEPNEIATAVQVPDPGTRAGGTYLKLERKVGDFATVGVAVHLSLDNGRVGGAGIALTGVGPKNLRATAAEQALAGAELNDDTIRAAAEAAAEESQPRSDHRGTADYKRSVVRVFTERGLRKAAETAAA